MDQNYLLRSTCSTIGDIDGKRSSIQAAEANASEESHMKVTVTHVTLGCDCTAVRVSAATSIIMSLPRSNYDPRRVCLNPFPNVSLGKYRRTIGIYLAGGLVRYFSISPCYLVLTL